MTDVLIIGDTMRSPELRHEVPIAIPDPLLYAEVGGRRSVVVSSLEAGRVRGSIASNDIVVFDLFPRDRESACFSDFTRTFSVGAPSEELKEYHRLAKQALDLAIGAVRPGVRGSDIHRQVCDFFHDHGYKTQLHKEEGEVLQDGYFHATGHGVGLEVHERPGLGRVESEPLLAGDVIAVEPGLYRHGFGGARLEDLLLVTEDGCELLTQFPYDLEL